MSDFKNVYEKADYAEAYAGLGWTGTYLLVERDLPGILSRYVTGRRALDFGCGTGRSSRLLRDCGFEVTGVDVSTSMVEHARMADPTGDYRLLEGGDLTALPAASFDLVLAAFPFDNIPAAGKEHLLGGIARLLATNGRFVNIVSSPEIYIREWASFSTRAWPENLEARDGDIVRIVTRDLPAAGARRRRRSVGDVAEKKAVSLKAHRLTWIKGASRRPAQPSLRMMETITRRRSASMNSSLISSGVGFMMVGGWVRM